MQEIKANVAFFFKMNDMGKLHYYPVCMCKGLRNCFVCLFVKTKFAESSHLINAYAS